MTDQRTPLDRLQLAIEKEQKETAVKQSSYENLISKITNFQLGAGPPPSVEDFLHWRVEAIERERKRAFDKARPGLHQRPARTSNSGAQR